jgi:hypothetical protein
LYVLREVKGWILYLIPIRDRRGISIRSLALTRHVKTAIATPEKRLGLRRKICEIWDRSQLLKRGHP